jgi:hypothetical protein
MRGNKNYKFFGIKKAKGRRKGRRGRERQKRNGKADEEGKGRRGMERQMRKGKAEEDWKGR